MLTFNLIIRILVFKEVKQMPRGGKRDNAGAKPKEGFVLARDGIRVTIRVTPDMKSSLDATNAQALITKLLNDYFKEHHE